MLIDTPTTPATSTNQVRIDMRVRYHPIIGLKHDGRHWYIRSIDHAMQTVTIEAPGHGKLTGCRIRAISIPA